MKIAIHFISYELGGVDNIILNTINYWPCNDDQFIILYNDNNQGAIRIKESIVNENVNFIAIKENKNNWLTKFVNIFLFPGWFYSLQRKVSKVLRKIKNVDLIMVHNGTYPGENESLAAMWAAKKLKINKRILVVHHGAVHGRIMKNPFEKYINYAIQNIWATDIVCVSRATRQTMIDYRNFDPYLNPIRVIHNGVELNENIDSKQPFSFREKYNINSEAILVGIVGRVERYKGHEDLILALDELPVSLKKNYHVIIIGVGSDAEISRLNKLAKYVGVEKQIHFTGFLEGKITTWMNQLDLVTMLTKDFEGFGLTIIEAMAVGVPVIATSVGAVPEFVNSTNGWLVPPESPESFADILVQFNNSQEKFIEKAKNAKKDINKFDTKIMASRYHRLVNL